MFAQISRRTSRGSQGRENLTPILQTRKIGCSCGSLICVVECMQSEVYCSVVRQVILCARRDEKDELERLNVQVDATE
jgi:hypothetical protein